MINRPERFSGEGSALARSAVVISKPWEKGPPGKKKVDPVVEQAKTHTARKPWNPTPRDVGQEEISEHNAQAQVAGSAVRMNETFAMILAKAFAVHGDMTLALLQTERYPADDGGLDLARRHGWKYRGHPLFQAALEAVLSRFCETDILTRDRVLAGLYTEAADRGPATTSSSRVAAWGKLAMLLGMEQEVKQPPKDEGASKSGVIMIPFTSDVEEWEQAAMGQQAKLKADVRL